MRVGWLENKVHLKFTSWFEMKFLGVNVSKFSMKMSVATSGDKYDLIY
jgi:hypothetical protein